MLDYINLQYIRYRTLIAYRSGDWKDIKIVESGQPLVRVPDDIAFPYYAKILKLANDENIYLRDDVLRLILDVRRLLRLEGFDLKVYDGWRSVELQNNLFWYYMKLFTTKQFGRFEEFSTFESCHEIKRHFESLPPETQATMIGANKTYVSLPSEDPLRPSPHATGGAVDVWLYDLSGQAVNLGVPFDWMQDEAGAFYHLKLPGGLERPSFFC